MTPELKKVVQAAADAIYEFVLKAGPQSGVEKIVVEIDVDGSRVTVTECLDRKN